MTKVFDRIIAGSFYTMFFFVPLIFMSNTSELFEFNKMWLTFILTIIIVGTWLAKMIMQQRFFVQRTILDIPILLFLLSQLISTIFSLDQHVSWWGYYSRFNGGFLSMLSYVLLYYAFVSNLSLKHTLRTLTVSLFAGLAVALWGFPSHFGADPTCLVFRGSLDTDCWTEAFKPTIRAFSTLGQPAWFAAYLALLLPLAMAYAVKYPLKSGKFWLFVAFTALLYLCEVFADTRAGYLSFVAADILFWVLLYVKKFFAVRDFVRYAIIFNTLFLVSSFFFGLPVDQLNKFTLPAMTQNAQNAAAQTAASSDAATQPAAANNINITDSGKIRLYVWHGAIDAWKANPIFGTGVETFAYAYYKFRPAGHNTTSEWDYLYNKAHNEYLNYLTTTGIVGLGTYLLMIGLFLVLFVKYLFSQHATEEHHQAHNKHHTVTLSKYSQYELLAIALVTGYVSMLISNFFGFSVVIINLYLFLIPVFVFFLYDKISAEKQISFGSSVPSTSTTTNPFQWTGIIVVVLIAGYLMLGLFKYWYADVAYALGQNLDHVNQFQDAYPQLIQAVSTEPNEPVYKDELSINEAALAAGLMDQKYATTGAQLAEQAVDLNTQIISDHPNNVVFWKNRVRIFYTLADGDPAHRDAYLAAAVKAAEYAHELAPTDAKISYNLGVLYGQTGSKEKAQQMLEETVRLKPDYRDAYYALGLFYHQQAVDASGRVVHPELQDKAIQTYEYVLQHLNPNDDQVKKSLAEWQK